jgi:hypothetical protein
MDCGRFEEGLTDVALGARPADPAESAHLARCATCRARMEDERRAAAEVDGLLAEALALEPPPGLMARVRERVSREPAPSVGQWPLPPRALAAGVALVALAAALWWPRNPSEPSHASRTAAASSEPPAVAGAGSPAALTPPALHGPATVRSEPVRPRRGPAADFGSRRVAPARRAPTATPSDPEVLVAPGQEEQLLRLVAALRSGRVEAGSLAASRAASDEMIPPKPIEIPPLDGPSGSDGGPGRGES